MKPLFVPLKRIYFEQIELGIKHVEYRPDGPRWNADTCTPGREIIFSLGYSGRRIKARITRFASVPLNECEAQHIVRAIYGDIPRVAEIYFEVETGDIAERVAEGRNIWTEEVDDGKATQDAG